MWPLRAGVLATLALLLSAQAATLIDTLTFRHVTCAEHGELMHAEGAPVAAPVDTHEHADAPTDGTDHPHEHCAAMTLGREQATVRSAPHHTPARAFVALASTAQPRDSHSPLAALDLAPKCSPPASAA